MWYEAVAVGDRGTTRGHVTSDLAFKPGGSRQRKGEWDLKIIQWVFLGRFKNPCWSVKTTGCLDRVPTARSRPTALQPHSASDKTKLRLSHSDGQKTCWPLAPEGYRVIVTYTGKNDRKWAISTVLHTGRDRVVWLPVTVVSGDLWWSLVIPNCCGTTPIAGYTFYHVLSTSPCAFGHILDVDSVKLARRSPRITEHTASSHQIPHDFGVGPCWAIWKQHWQSQIHPQRGTNLRLTWKWHEQFEHIGSMSFYVFLCLLVSATAIPSFNNF